MAFSITNDRATQVARTALDGLALQQELIGHNLANVDTPGYRAQTASFQNALQNALGASDWLEMRTTHVSHQAAGGRADDFILSTRPGGSVRADGNDVDIDVELGQMAETGIRYQSISQAVSKKLILLKSLASGR